MKNGVNGKDCHGVSVLGGGSTRAERGEEERGEEEIGKSRFGEQAEL